MFKCTYDTRRNVRQDHIGLITLDEAFSYPKAQVGLMYTPIGFSAPEWQLNNSFNSIWIRTV